jgi:hypothetical protein
MSQEPIRKQRKDSHLSVEERQVINKYKEEYRSQTTRELRGDVFRNKIQVDMLDYWKTQGMDITDETETQNRIKVIVNTTDFDTSLLDNY